MEFKNRMFGRNFSMINERRLKYAEHIRQNNLYCPMLVPFIWDFFHDSDFNVHMIDMTKQELGLRLFNILAMDSVSDLLPSTKQKSLNREDFLTTIRFSGISRVELRLRPNRPPQYHSCELYRQGSGYNIIIALYEFYGNNPCSWIRFDFQKVDVEDITRKVQRYVGLSDARRLLRRPGQYPCLVSHAAKDKKG
ncbi:MAG: hypothetical protein WCI73_01185 [Phycisphaerae bacterium]